MNVLLDEVFATLEDLPRGLVILLCTVALWGLIVLAVLLAMRLA